MKKALIIICSILSAASCSKAPVTLPEIFSDHMVLQRDRSIPVWGWSDPRAKITLTWQGSKSSVRADGEGFWKAELPATPAGGPYELKLNDSIIQ